MLPRNSKYLSKLFSFTLSFPVLLVLSFGTPHATAEIYKWVDENGRVHFSDQKQGAGKASVQKLKVEATNVLEKSNTRPIYSSNGQFKAHNKQNRANLYPPQRQSSKHEWGGKGAETDAKRCALARDILSGEAVHSNGMPTDSYDIKVARRDVEKFCH